MKYFSLAELTQSQTATRKGLNNTPNATIKQHLNELVDNILDPLREAWGSPIVISSGYRSPKVNKAVGGSTTSAHVTGYAADTYPANGNMKEYQEFVKEFLKDKNFDQYICEYPKKGIASWIHIGYKNSKGLQRKQYLIIK